MSGIKRTLQPVSLAVMVGLLGNTAITKSANAEKSNNAVASSANKVNQQITKDQTTDNQSTTNEHILVRGKKNDNILTQNTGVSLMPQDIMHTPQNINLVPAKIMEEQNVKSLDEALKNVPGVTSSVGEGRGGMSGNQFLIRGFQAQNDIYEDGLRDFGVYSRDSFNYENVVVKIGRAHV